MFLCDYLGNKSQCGQEIQLCLCVHTNTLDEGQTYNHSRSKKALTVYSEECQFTVINVNLRLEFSSHQVQVMVLLWVIGALASQPTSQRRVLLPATAHSPPVSVHHSAKAKLGKPSFQVFIVCFCSHYPYIIKPPLCRRHIQSLACLYDKCERQGIFPRPPSRPQVVLLFDVVSGQTSGHHAVTQNLSINASRSQVCNVHLWSQRSGGGGMRVRSSRLTSATQ